MSEDLRMQAAVKRGKVEYQNIIVKKNQYNDKYSVKVPWTCEGAQGQYCISMEQSPDEENFILFIQESEYEFKSSI